MLKTKQLYNYLAMHPNVMVRFHPSNMILNILSNASYLSEVAFSSWVGALTPQNPST
jgi:hypothetical protein